MRAWLRAALAARHDRRMRALAPTAAALAALAAAEPALACGFCFDNSLTLAWWGWPAVAGLGAVLLLEVPVTAVVWRRLRYRPALRRRWVALAALVLSLAFSLLIGGSALALGLGLLVVLLPAFLLSLRRELPGSALARWLRPAGVAATWLLLSVPRLPSQQSTEHLLRVATYPLHATPADSWVVDELVRRSDAHAAVDALLARDAAAQKPTALALHGRLSDAAHHAEVCARALAETTGAARERLADACGPR